MDELKSEISFRAMRHGEETEVVDLVLDVFSEFVAPYFSDEGVLEFKKFVNGPSILERFRSGNPIIVAILKNEIIGVIEIRDNNHITLCFVKRSFQKMGVGKKLLCEAVKVCRERNRDIEKITVNSSLNAYAAYRQFGFKGENTEKTVNGIRFIPLELELSQ